MVKLYTTKCENKGVGFLFAFMYVYCFVLLTVRVGVQSMCGPHVAGRGQLSGVGLSSHSKLQESTLSSGFGSKCLYLLSISLVRLFAKKPCDKANLTNGKQNHEVQGQGRQGNPQGAEERSSLVPHL